MYRSPSRISAWNMANARPRRLTYSCRANATGAPGQLFASLSVINKPSIIDSHSSPNATNAEARERNQYPCGIEPISEAAICVPRSGKSMMAPRSPSSTPITMLANAANPKVGLCSGAVDGEGTGIRLLTKRWLQISFQLAAVQPLTVLEQEQSRQAVVAVQPCHASRAAGDEHSFCKCFCEHWVRGDHGGGQHIGLGRQARAWVDD